MKAAVRKFLVIQEFALLVENFLRQFVVLNVEKQVQMMILKKVVQVAVMPLILI